MAADELSHAAFEVVSGAEPGANLPLAAASTTFGRAPGNTHVVKDAAISRQHAKVFVRDGRHWIADLNSSHGTFVNGTKITLQTLVDGDEVKLGTTVLRYVAARAKPKPEAVAPASVPAGPSKAAIPAPAPSPEDAGSSTGSFELELPDTTDGPAASPATRGPLPPIATGYRRALAPTGEDPFADEAAADAPTAEAAAPPKQGASAAPSAKPDSSAAPSPKPRASAAPSIELRGETARQFASRGAAPPAAAASGATSKAAHAPPPLSTRPRKRGAFTFLRDELDQRGPAARVAAALFALALAAALFWLALHVFSAAPKQAEPGPADENAPQGPSGPVLPPRH